jgi:cytochrome b
MTWHLLGEIFGVGCVLATFALFVRLCWEIWEAEKAERRKFEQACSVRVTLLAEEASLDAFAQWDEGLQDWEKEQAPWTSL